MKFKMLIVSGFILFSSCGYFDDEIESNADNKTKQTKVIYGTHSGENYLNINDIIMEDLSYGNIEGAILNHNRFQHMRGLMSFEYGVIDDPSDVGRGSAKLTTSNMLITASHVTQKLRWCPDLIADPLVQTSTDYYYDNIDGGLYQSFSPYYQLKNKKDDWMLRYRLKGLGLENWAKYDVSYDTILNSFVHGDDTTDANLTKMSQIVEKLEYWAVDFERDWSDENRDVALLKTVSKEIEDSPNRESTFSSFKALGPGMFFDIYGISCSKCTGTNFGYKPPKAGDKITTYHYTHPMYDSSTWVNTGVPPFQPPIKSKSESLQKTVNVKFDDAMDNDESVLDEELTNNGWTPSETFCGDPLPPLVSVPTYNYFTPVFYDTKPGSSGGAVFKSPSSPIYSTEWVGVVSYGKGKENHDEAIDPSEQYRYAPSIPQNNDNIDYFTQFSPNMKDYIDENTGNRGFPYFGITPEPNSINIDSCIKNSPPNEQLGCLANTPLNPDTFDVTIDEWFCVGVGCKDGVSGPDNSPTKRREYTDISCLKEGLAHRTPNIAVGILGAARVKNTILPDSSLTERCLNTALTRKDRQYELGTFGLICSPVSYTDWSMNWDFIIGRGVAKTDDCLLTKEDEPTWPFYTTLGGKLSSIILRAMAIHRIQVDEKDTIRNQPSALPMQMCRPGYVLRGLRLNIDGERIEGVVGVYCSNSMTGEDTFCDNASNKNNYPCYIALHTEERRGFLSALLYLPDGTPERVQYPMPLTQYIGDPLESSNSKDVVCSTGKIIVATRLPADSTGPTSFMDIGCKHMP